jgi:exosortase A-associated hydrolase 1
MRQDSSVPERALTFRCRGEDLIGIIHPSWDDSETVVIVLVGGPQYRVGSHRQFVLLARHLARAGYPVLRFDVRGMGDSSGDARSFESIEEDVAAAIDCVQVQLPATRRMVLWGLCDGASAALLYLHTSRDPRVQGLCLLNPWVRSEASLARTHIKHYYSQRVLQASFWRKLITGKVGSSSLLEVLRSLRLAVRPRAASFKGQVAAPYQRRMAEAWARFGGRVMLVLSGRDLTAKEFVEYLATGDGWQAALEHPGLEKHEFAGADHTFSDAASRTALEDLTLVWLRQWAPVSAPDR